MPESFKVKVHEKRMSKRKFLSEQIKGLKADLLKLLYRNFLGDDRNFYNLKIKEVRVLPFRKSSICLSNIFATIPSEIKINKSDNGIRVLAFPKIAVSMQKGTRTGVTEPRKLRENFCQSWTDQTQSFSNYGKH